MSLFRVGSPAPADSLDSSWMAVLGWAFSHGAQFGKDLIFTYGPLGFLIPISTYYPGTFLLFFAAQVVLACTWAVLIARFALRLRLLLQLVLILLVLSWVPIVIIDVGWYLMFVLAAVFVREDLQRGWRGALFGLAMLFALSVIALTKFTFLLLWLAFVGHLLLQLLVGRRPIAAATAAATAALLMFGLWTVAGQQPASLPAFFWNGLEISRAYAAGMGYTPHPLVDIAGLGALALSALCVAPLLRPRDPGRCVLGAFILLTLLLAWKAGYIRADAHVCIFLGSASLITFFATTLSADTPPRHRFWESAAVCLISLGGLLLTYVLLGGVSTTLHNSWQFAGFSLDKLFSPERARVMFEANWQASARRFDLPSVRRHVGDASIDLLMHEQGVLLLNDFDYAPRPLFQGYSAGSTELARLNETRLLGDAAPRFLLFKLQAIDGRLPGSEDALAQIAALRAYTPVDYEKGYVLLERSRPSAPVRRSAQWRETSFGEEIAVPTDSPQILFFRVELSLPGRLYSALFREPDLGLQVIGDNSAAQEYRLVRGLGDAGSLVSPVLPHNAAYLDWYAKQHEFRPRALRFVAHVPALGGLFSPQLSYALQPVELPRLDKGDLPERLRLAFHPGFSHLPTSERGPVPMRIIRNLGEEVLLMHAPSSIGFVLPAGRWRAEGRFGLNEASYTPGVCPQGDGALFRIYRGDAFTAPGASVLYTRQIDPVRVESDRGALAFVVPSFDSDGVAPLTLEFSSGSLPSATTDCDWTFLGPLQLTPLPTAAR